MAPMSAPSLDEPAGLEPNRRTSAVAKGVAAVVAVVALIVGVSALTNKSSTTTATAAGGFAPPAQTQSQNGTSPSGVPPAGMPQGAPPPGMGTDVTGSTMTKLSNAVASDYPGQIERAEQLPDGSYVVHVIASDGSEQHVLVSKDFKVQGAQAGGPPGGQVPQQTAPSSGGTSNS
jgi:hypothetical protein